VTGSVIAGNPGNISTGDTFRGFPVGEAPPAIAVVAKGAAK